MGASVNLTSPLLGSIVNAAASAPVRLKVTPSLTSAVSSAVAVYTNWLVKTSSTSLPRLPEVMIGAVSSTLLTAKLTACDEALLAPSVATTSKL